MSFPRIRVHTDGRWAIFHEPHGGWAGLWRCSDPDCTGHIKIRFDEVEMFSEPGWSEAAVVELPEPDGWADVVGDDGEDTRTPYWRTSWGESVTAWIEGVETPVWDLREDLDAIRADALKMLAAVAACERFRVQRQRAPEHDGTGPPICEPCSADCPACSAESQGGEPQ